MAEMSWSICKVLKSWVRTNSTCNGMIKSKVVANILNCRGCDCGATGALMFRSCGSQASSSAEPSMEPVCSSRFIPKSKDEVLQLTGQKLIQPPNPKILQVAIMGIPNSGKSTLANKLMGWRVCSVSKKVHTTRCNAKAVYTLGNTQIIFLDTPGLITAAEKKKFNLEESMLVDPEESLKDADLVLVLVDVADKWTRHKLNSNILRLLNQYQNKKAILVLNKVDILKSKRLLLDIVHSLTLGKIDNQEALVVVKERPKVKTTEELFKQTMKKLRENSLEATPVHLEKMTGWPHFSQVFMISAVQDDGVKDLKNYVLNHAKPGLWKYPASFVTDQTPHDIAILAVRGRFLDNFKQEIPYSIKWNIELWEADQHGLLRIVMLVQCPTNNVAKIVIGPAGKAVAKIAEEARQDLMNTFRCDVLLKLVVETGKK